MDDNPRTIDRSVYELRKAFSVQIHGFPTYRPEHPEIGVLVRMFSQADWAPVSHEFVYEGLWSMRSRVLNSDVGVFKPQIVFHIEDVLYDTAKPIFEEAGIPEDWIIVFPSDIVVTELENNALHKAAAPFLDTQLDRFEHVIVLDSDSFCLAGGGTAPVPLMDVSLNKLRPDTISMLRGWPAWDMGDDDGYANWYNRRERGCGERGIEEYAKIVAYYCNTRPEFVKALMYPDEPGVTRRPHHNGAYINIPMGALRHNLKFREFIREVSGVLGDEEQAMFVWAIKFYLETGKYYPPENLQDYIYSEYAFSGAEEKPQFGIRWSVDEAREQAQSGTPMFLHSYVFEWPAIRDYAFDFAKELGASDEEATTFRNALLNDLNHVAEPEGE